MENFLLISFADGRGADECDAIGAGIIGIIYREHDPVDTKLGDEYWKLYSKKHMRAVSIGFRIIDDHEVTEGGKATV